VLDGLQTLSLMSDDDRLRLPVVVVSGHGDIECAVKAIKLGAVDFLEKPCAEQLMLDAINASLALLSKNAAKASGKRDAKALIDRLTRRERDVLAQLLDGKPNKVAATDLGLSVRTIEMHRGNLMDRLGVRSIGEAMRLALLSDEFST
jgi:two-component system, LuxR family, response regulator FixJ